MDRAVPDSSFAEIASDLTIYATNEARSLEGVEIYLARYPHQHIGADVLPAARRAALTAGRLAALFAALVPHEETVRDFFVGLLSDRPATDLPAVPGPAPALPTPRSRRPGLKSAHG